MKVIITGKNYKVDEKLEQFILKKFEKLDKFFSEDSEAKVVASPERGKNKLEVTVTVKNGIFRSEQVGDDPRDAIEQAVDKISRQMSKFKGKLQKKHHDSKSLKFELIPQEAGEAENQVNIVKTKEFTLRPMSAEEAALEMEMLQHDFFVYLNMETDSVNVVYKRKDGNYGVLVTK